MNSTINASTASDNRAYHTFANAEFTGAFDRMVYNANTNERRGYIFDYHLFIKYGDKVYMDVHRIGEIVISFAELQKNKFWKYYYDLSLLLANNKNMVAEDLKYIGDYLDIQIYDRPRLWSIDTAFIECSINTKITKVINHCDVCYYKINPYDLETMEYTTQDDLRTFESSYMTRTEFRNKVFDKTCVIYNNLALDYNINLMEKELDELSSIIEDKKNAIYLIKICDKYKIIGDLQTIIYANLQGNVENQKYTPYIAKAGTCDMLELLAQILSA